MTDLTRYSPSYCIKRPQKTLPLQKGVLRWKIVNVKDESKRKSRNLLEKKRRDQFNTLVTELGVMVNPGSNRYAFSNLYLLI